MTCQSINKGGVIYNASILIVIIWNRTSLKILHSSLVFRFVL